MIFFVVDLLPNLQPFDGINMASMVVMDNLSVHHTMPVADLLNDSGVVLQFLPPYSPDLNPIEEAFSYIKINITFSCTKILWMHVIQES